jgi:hypothetical protein
VFLHGCQMIDGGLGGSLPSRRFGSFCSGEPGDALGAPWLRGTREPRVGVFSGPLSGPCQGIVSMHGDSHPLG